MTPRWRADGGAGLLATSFGVAFFLAFLLAATQLLLHLHALSVLQAVTDDAASRAARQVPVATVEAEARAALGDLGRDATFSWGGDDERLVVSITTTSPVAGPLADALGVEQLERTASARREALR